MNFLFLTLLLVHFGSLSVFGEDCCPEYCYGQDAEKPQTRQFATKTAYTLAKGKDFGNQYSVSTCKPKKIWILSRHGTRLPKADLIQRFPELDQIRTKIIANYRERKTKPENGALCPEDFFAIQTWRPNSNITVDYSEYLTSQGRSDMRILAKVYQRMYPEVLQKYYDERYFLFRHTGTERTQSSFYSFAEGLFGMSVAPTIKVPPVSENNLLLKSYDQCPMWKEQEKKVKEPGSEPAKFEETPIMQAAVRNISRRLGFIEPLQRAEIELIWDVCRYEKAWYLDRNSPWCAAFTPEEISVLEYAEDLKYYYKSGHGNELNSKVMCAAVNDMITKLDDSNEPHVMAYFTHSAAVQTFLTSLGIAKDSVPLKADLYEAMRKREWKTSEISPFSANLVAVKYDCQSDPVDRNKVMFLLNQNPVHLNWCDVGLCNWSDVRTRYARFINQNCSEIFCENAGSRLHISSFVLFNMIASLLMYLRFY